MLVKFYDFAIKFNGFLQVAAIAGLGAHWIFGNKLTFVIFALTFPFIPNRPFYDRSWMFMDTFLGTKIKSKQKRAENFFAWYIFWAIILGLIFGGVFYKG